MMYSTSDSSLDGLVKLEHISRRRNHPPGWARTVSYQFAAQIPEIMRSGSGHLPSSLNPDAAAFVPRRVTSAINPDVEESGNRVDNDDAQHTTEVDVEAISRAVPSDAVPVAEYSEKQREAILRISLAYQRLRSKRQAESKGGVTATRNILFKDCLTKLPTLNFPRPYYRLLFLGPLPHILLCLAAAHNYARNSKSDVRRRMQDAKHEEYEELMDNQTKYR
jgi:hypothetical protein